MRNIVWRQDNRFLDLDAQQKLQINNQAAFSKWWCSSKFFFGRFGWKGFSFSSLRIFSSDSKERPKNASNSIFLERSKCSHTRTHPHAHTHTHTISLCFSLLSHNLIYFVFCYPEILSYPTWFVSLFVKSFRFAGVSNEPLSLPPSLPLPLLYNQWCKREKEREGGWGFDRGNNSEYYNEQNSVFSFFFFFFFTQFCNKTEILDSSSRDRDISQRTNGLRLPSHLP